MPTAIATLRYPNNHFASLNRPAFEAIADLRLYEHGEVPPGASLLTVREALEPVPVTDKRRRVTFCAGLVHRIVSLLTLLGIAIRGAEQPRQWSLNAHRRNNAPQHMFLKRMDGRLRSLAIVPKLNDQINLIAEMCRLRRDVHVVVVTRTNAESATVGKRLKAATGRRVTWHPQRWTGHPWLRVMSIPTLQFCNTLHWGLIVFLDAERAVSKTGYMFMNHASRAVRVGFLVREEHELLCDEHLIVEGLFGPVIHRPSDDAPASDVSVAWLRPKVTSMATGNILERKRTGIWTNQPRNQLIATAARSLAESNLVALERLGLRDAARLLQSSTKTVTAAIIVENVEHGQQLARLLPGWRLERAGYSPPPGQCVHHNRMIMTKARAAETILATSVVIYAAGGDEQWLAQTRLTRAALFHRNMLVVDVADHHDRQSSVETGVRAAEYQRLGFRYVTRETPIGPNQIPGGNAMTAEGRNTMSTS